MKLSPIALFAYNRPVHLYRTVEALKQNGLAGESDLYIFSDAPKSISQTDMVLEVRRYIHQISGFKSVTVIERESNFGLARSIMDGVTTIINKHGCIIVLEDDMLTSPYFLSYMNEALEKYADDDRVISIHGYVYPVKQQLPEAFFLLGADCWGWATWQRGWEIFNSDGQYLLDELKRRKLINTFDFNGTYPFSKMLKDQINGKNDSWAVRWYASAYLAGKLTLYPGQSLIQNIGNDNSGSHCGESDRFDTALRSTPIKLDEVKVKLSQRSEKEFERYFRKSHGSVLQKLLRKIITAIGMKT